jgi:hypothetical protein
MVGQTRNLGGQMLEGWPCQKQNHTCICDVISAYIFDKILWKCVNMWLKCNCVVGKPWKGMLQQKQDSF